LAAFDSSFEARFVRAIYYDDEPCDLPFFFIRRSVFIRIKERNKGTLNHHRGDFFRISIQPWNYSNRLCILTSQRAHSGSGHL
jgi:hypothetical protein